MQLPFGAPLSRKPTQVVVCLRRQIPDSGCYLFNLEGTLSGILNARPAADDALRVDVIEEVDSNRLRRILEDDFEFVAANFGAFIDQDKRPVPVGGVDL